MPESSTGWNNQLRSLRECRRYGFSVEGNWTGEAFRAKPRSHDDGPGHGPFLGGLGTGTFSRDLTGAFSRWHLQPGYHIVQAIPQARFLVHHTSDSGSGCRYLGLGKPAGWENYTPSFDGFPAESRTYAALFPECFEHYDDNSLPYELILNSWSPLTFGDPDSALPVVISRLSAKNTTDDPASLTAALFWPNLLGWRQSRVTPIARGDTSWPGHTHAGNSGRAAILQYGAGVVQTRDRPAPGPRDMEGEVLISVAGPAGSEYSRELCFKADLNALGVEPADQRHTQAWAEEYFAAHGLLPGSEKSWNAHWFEPLSSAVACSVNLEPRAQCELVFLQVFDLPRLTFGSDRCWNKMYTRRFGIEGNNSEKIAEYAFERLGPWETQKTEQQQRVLVDSRIDSDRVKGAMLNELFFLSGGGTSWTGSMVPVPEWTNPTLGDGEHFGILEGYDDGYYYYNTFDLWVYAFPALASTWPELARGVFRDYLKSATSPDLTPRIVYRVMEERPVLARHKIPHDIGVPMEDPWHLLNGYTMRDDPNNWLDHNPAMIISYYLLSRRCNFEIDEHEWEILTNLADHLQEQDRDNDGLPEHAEFGDTTWDALKFEGVGAFSGGLTIAAHAAMAALAHSFGDEERRIKHERLQQLGVESYEQKLWNGSYYRSTSSGIYAERIMVEALLGPFYARLSGLDSGLPEDHIVSHLEAAYRHNYLAYGDGAVGPLLVASRSEGPMTPDGGEELQINEVLVGAAWAYCAMLYEYGMTGEAAKVATSLVDTLYSRSGLQFRTPAAWDADSQFRAPLNMRPLAVWLLNWLT